jgi:hypothetical protein
MDCFIPFDLLCLVDVTQSAAEHAQRGAGGRTAAAAATTAAPAAPTDSAKAAVGDDSSSDSAAALGSSEGTPGDPTAKPTVTSCLSWSDGADVLCIWQELVSTRKVNRMEDGDVESAPRGEGAAEGAESGKAAGSRSQGQATSRPGRFIPTEVRGGEGARTPCYDVL